MFYTRDEHAIRRVLRCFLQELAKSHECSELEILNEKLPLIGVRALFLFLVVTDPKLRYWTMQYETKNIQKPLPAKVCGFLKCLRDEIIPNWKSDERKQCRDLVRKATELYIRS